jgi:starch phosphorylase
MLRLWSAAAHHYFDFQEFSHGDFVGALVESLAAHTLTRVLYPDDSTELGRELRFLQEYFLVACSLADLVRRFRRDNADWAAFPDKIAIQLNDTHPTLAVRELMRILLDDAHLGWDEPGVSPRGLWPTPTTHCCPKPSKNGRCTFLSKYCDGI